MGISPGESAPQPRSLGGFEPLAPMPAAHELRQVHGPWLITLGDVLTLLLCFFISIITLQEPGKISASSGLAKEAVQPSGVGRTGTTLAPPHSVLGEDLSRFDQILILSETDLLDPSLNRLWDWVRRGSGSAAGAVTVLGCNREGQEVPETVLREVAGILKENLPIGVPLRVQDLGIGCQELNARLQGKSPDEARLIVLKEATSLNHG